ncbi:MAG: hypothetical protein ACXADO_01590 [Candidatus Thorarchaeota archaeon]|jgi:hypothetical protein
MIERSELETWTWILKYWVIVFPTLLVTGVVLGQLGDPSYYWIPFVVGVPLTIIPVTYRNLVGGGCSLRFQMCALVKGMTAGVIFLFLSLAADYYAWNVLEVYLGWSPLAWTFSMSIIYQLWFFSGAMGGFGARIMEVRGYSKSVERTPTLSVLE